MYFKNIIVTYNIVPYITIIILIILDILLRNEIYLYFFDYTKINTNDLVFYYTTFFINIIFGIISIIRLLLGKKYKHFEQDLKSGAIPTQKYLGTINKIEPILSGEEGTDKNNQTVERFYIIMNVNINGKEKKYKSDRYSSGLTYEDFSKKLNGILREGDNVTVYINTKNIHEYYIEDLSQKLNVLKKDN